MTNYLTPLIVACLAISCVSNTHEAELERAEKIASQLHVGMTYEQVSKILPLTRQHEVPLFRHGGVVCEVPVGKMYYIELRFDRSKDGSLHLENKLNLPARVRQAENCTVLPSQ